MITIRFLAGFWTVYSSEQAVMSFASLAQAVSFAS